MSANVGSAQDTKLDCHLLNRSQTTSQLRPKIQTDAVKRCCPRGGARARLYYSQDYGGTMRNWDGDGEPMVLPQEAARYVQNLTV